MATRVGPSTVSYGIGVQNRYSAFLEDEDSFALSNIIKRPNNENHVVNKPKSAVSVAKSNVAKTIQRSDSSSTNKKQDGQQKGPSSHANGNQAKGDMRRQQRDGKPQQQHQVNSSSNQTVRTHANRSRNYNQDNATTTNGTQRSPRNQYNGHNQQQPDSSTQQHGKENQSNQNGRSMRPNNLRSNPRPRPNQNDETKSNQQRQDGLQINGHLASNDEEKARRQQRRLNNLKYKDPEKREQRNQANAENVDSQVKVDNDESSADQRGQKNRRDMDKNRARPRRNNVNGETQGDAPARRENRRERPNRQRNGFGGSHSEVGKQEKPKPIPNFSDKSDFPSLAS